MSEHICRCCQKPQLPQDMQRGVCIECIGTSRGIACMTLVEHRRLEVAESGQAYADECERLHGHAGQPARRIFD